MGVARRELQLEELREEVCLPETDGIDDSAEHVEAFLRDQTQDIR